MNGFWKDKDGRTHEFKWHREKMEKIKKDTEEGIQKDIEERIKNFDKHYVPIDLSGLQRLFAVAAGVVAFFIITPLLKSGNSNVDATIGIMAGGLTIIAFVMLKGLLDIFRENKIVFCVVIVAIYFMFFHHYQ